MLVDGLAYQVFLATKTGTMAEVSLAAKAVSLSQKRWGGLTNGIVAITCEGLQRRIHGHDRKGEV